MRNILRPFEWFLLVLTIAVVTARLGSSAYQVDERSLQLQARLTYSAFSRAALIQKAPLEEKSCDQIWHALLSEAPLLYPHSQTGIWHVSDEEQGCRFDFLTYDQSYEFYYHRTEGRLSQLQQQTFLEAPK